jgi:chromosome segregation ATPase
MNWAQRLAGEIFGKVYKNLSEQESDADMKAFDAEATKVAGELDQKDARITELEGLLETAKAEKKGLDGKLATANETIQTQAAELSAFGATTEAREAYKAEHVRLAGWYDEQKGKKDEKGEDNDSKNRGGKIETKSEKRAELKEKFPGLL